MAYYDSIDSLDKLDEFIYDELDKSGNMPVTSFARLCGFTPKELKFDLLDIRTDLTKFLSDRNIFAYHFMDNGIAVSELFEFLFYYSQDEQERFTHVTNKDGYVGAKAILKLPKLKEHLAEFNNGRYD